MSVVPLKKLVCCQAYRHSRAAERRGSGREARQIEGTGNRVIQADISMRCADAEQQSVDAS